MPRLGCKPNYWVRFTTGADCILEVCQKAADSKSASKLSSLPQKIKYGCRYYLWREMWIDEVRSLYSRLTNFLFLVFKELLLKSAELRIQPLAECDAMINNDVLNQAAAIAPVTLQIGNARLCRAEFFKLEVARKLNGLRRCFFSI